MQTTDMADVASRVQGVEVAGTRALRIESTVPGAAYRSFIALTYLTRQAGGR